MELDAQAAAARLIGSARLLSDALYLRLQPDCRLVVRSNSAALIDKLAGYFGHLAAEPGAVDIEVIAIESGPPELPRTLVDFVDWTREPGKQGRKDAYVDLPGGRLVRKVRTGMLFLQRPGSVIAAGPCMQYDNQVINFINAQYMNWLQHRRWLICHAAGLVRRSNGVALGIAGLSGGGKSTLMLHLMEQDGVDYLTNDRLFIRCSDGEDAATVARGIPKMPRINPGTIVHNPRLAPLIPVARRRHLLALPEAELWRLEEKHDLMIESLFGCGRIAAEARLGAFLVLNWRRAAAQPQRVARIDPAERTDLLGAIMKSPGPFYQDAAGRFWRDDDRLPRQGYLQVLVGVPVYEVSGRLDFAALSRYCSDRFFGG